MKQTLAACRRTKKITQSQMAKMLGISKPVYSKMEKDPKNISIYYAVRIAQALETKIDNIIF